MCARVINLAAERRRRARAAISAMAREAAPSIEITREQVPAFASPPVLHQLAVMLDDDPVELEFIPRATMIERLRFTHSFDELREIVRITLE